MNEPSMHTSDAAMSARQQKLQNRQQSQAGFVFLIPTVSILFILPNYLTSPYDVMSMGFGSAAMFSTFLYLYSDSLRSRGGSLVPALWLAVTLWLLAVIGTAVSLID